MVFMKSWYKAFVKMHSGNERNQALSAEVKVIISRNGSSGPSNAAPRNTISDVQVSDRATKATYPNQTCHEVGPNR